MKNNCRHCKEILTKDIIDLGNQPPSNNYLLSDVFHEWSYLPNGRTLIAGWFVGFGASLGNGCTSGHGICGISSFNLRSLVATCTFMMTGIISSIVLNTSTHLPTFTNNNTMSEVVPVTIGSMVSVMVVTLIGSDNTLFKFFSELFYGICFAIGLSVSNMTKSAATIAFLDIRFMNPALMFVMVAAISVALTCFSFTFKMNKPLLETNFALSQLKNIDASLIVGSAIFGIGWGMLGACPAPAITNLANIQNSIPIMYFLSLVSGILSEQIFSKIINEKKNK